MKDKLPVLRFAPFADAWERKKLGAVAEKVNSGKTPLGGEAVYTKTGVLFIRSQNVNKDRLELENMVFIPEDLNLGMKNSMVKANDILLNITGASLGRSCVVPADFSIGNVNQHVCIIRLKKEHLPRFVQPILASNNGQKIFQLLQTGSGREGLNFENIKGIEIAFPSLPEQTKIASFFTAIDTRIAQLQTKKRLLEQYKKGMMQQIFAQTLRFKAENGSDFPDWEEKKLGELGRFFSGGTPLTSKKHYFNGNIPFIRSGEIKLDITEQYISEEGLNNSSAKIIEVGDLIYALYGATSGEVAISKIKGAINQAILCIRTSLNNIFLLNYFLLHKETIVNNYLQGGQGNLSAEIIKSLMIPVPHLAEQNQIASFLSAIDARLTVTQRQIEQTETWKKGLFQRIFV